MPENYEHNKTCRCAWCKGTGRPEPTYGYDLDKVPAFQCSECREPIGEEPYIHIDGFARFGGMDLCHERCWVPRLSQMLSKPAQAELKARKKTAAKGEIVKPPSRTWKD